jgi:polyphosphate kinase
VLIRALYAASQAGVEIDLLVRGICCLRPGLPNVSERIRVTSVVDRFLEHSRAFAFGVGERTEVYAASADWMPRNFLRRVEVMFPVEDARAKQRVLEEVLGLGLRDNVKASRLRVDGSYARVQADGQVLRSQQVLAETARRSELVGLELLRHAVAPEVAPEPIRAAAVAPPPS